MAVSHNIRVEQKYAKKLLYFSFCRRLELIQENKLKTCRDAERL